ncbi:ciliary microtubule associated protein 1A-like [Cylas formicarius]|uniref:ciliary microtubule associated protein 1A-like n=1 Tax=Cylas formicarius TaxID=197179 RepID=UPI00295839D6|nr:ciliary microtubule associated protein 1A-like [Cylas formicarius]
MPRRNIGPGPGKYLLPPVVGFERHDFTRYRNPQYSMGLRLQSIHKALGPGPKYPIEKMTRFGKASPPAYSIKWRQKTTGTFHTPGPGTYAPEKAPRMKEPRPPAYSMSYRYPGYRPYVTPGPDKYEVPSTLGPKVPDKPANAAYSMSFRQHLRDAETSPGPAAYKGWGGDAHRPRAPIYTISPRVFPPDKQEITPGPIYFPKLPQKPGYSFGLRTDLEPYITADDDMPCINRD